MTGMNAEWPADCRGIGRAGLCEAAGAGLAKYDATLPYGGIAKRRRFSPENRDCMTPTTEYDTMLAGAVVSDTGIVTPLHPEKPYATGDVPITDVARQWP